MKRWVVEYLWKGHKDLLLDLKGFRNHHLHLEKEFLDLYFDLYRERTALLGIREIYNIYQTVHAVRHLDADMAEVGVYKGGSAKIICEAKGNRRLHLFDTFEGMPPVAGDIDKHREGDFGDTNLEKVKQYLKEYPEVSFHQGIFPESAARLAGESRSFSFVNLDVDIFQSTLTALEFFYPKMVSGGILLSHDYNNTSCPGVRKAYDLYFAGKPEPILALWDSQCIMIKN